MHEYFRKYADLSKGGEKFATLPSLQVRRRSRIVLGENDDDDSSRASASSTKSKGPEFILNSSLPCQEIEIGDSKVIEMKKKTTIFSCFPRM